MTDTASTPTPASDAPIGEAFIHRSPDTSRPDRIARASYNFVPLPRSVLTVGARPAAAEAPEDRAIRPWMSQDRWLPETLSGVIDIEIEALSPVFIRAGVTQRLTADARRRRMREGKGGQEKGGRRPRAQREVTPPEDLEWPEGDVRLRGQTYSSRGGKAGRVPAIPGSSLRGMVRNLVEVIGFGRLTGASEQPLPFRDVSDSRIGIAYRNRLREATPTGGVLRRVRGKRPEWHSGFELEPREMVRVGHQLLVRELDFVYRYSPRWTPSWTVQHRTVWVKVEGSRVIDLSRREPLDPRAWRKATLVITGSAGRDKRAEWAFLEPEQAALPLPEPVVAEPVEAGETSPSPAAKTGAVAPTATEQEAATAVAEPPASTDSQSSGPEIEVVVWPQLNPEAASEPDEDTGEKPPVAPAERREGEQAGPESGGRRRRRRPGGRKRSGRANAVAPNAQATEGGIPIPAAAWNMFHDPANLTEWQKFAFPKNRPHRLAREADGHMVSGEPIFVLCNPNAVSPDNPAGVVSIGRSPTARLPNDRAPEDLLPEDHLRGSPDLATVLFGTPAGVGRGGTLRGFRGRVRFSDAVAEGQEPKDGWTYPEFVPTLLTPPKPTAYQHYLTQDGTAGPDRLTTYLANDATTLRGFKFYWHRWTGSIDPMLHSDGRAIREYLRHPRLVQASHRGTLDQPAKQVAREPSARQRIDELKAKAQAGDGDAAYQLGLAFATGKGVRANPDEAKSWFLKAVELGHVDTGSDQPETQEGSSEKTAEAEQAEVTPPADPEQSASASDSTDDDTKPPTEVAERREPSQRAAPSGLPKARDLPLADATLMGPVREGVKFRGSIRFENLSTLELGALLAAIELPAECAHRIGMGKPLGLGSIRIKPTVRLTRPADRIRSWLASGEVNPEEVATTVAAAKSEFATTIMSHARQTGEGMIEVLRPDPKALRPRGQAPASPPAADGIWAITRLHALRCILGWDNRPDAESTRPMELERPYRDTVYVTNEDRRMVPRTDPPQYEWPERVNEFRRRPILPTPHVVLGLLEPVLPGKPAEAAAPEPDQDAALRRGRHGGRQDGRSDSRGPRPPRDDSRGPRPPRRDGQAGPGGPRQPRRDGDDRGPRRDSGDRGPRMGRDGDRRTRRDGDDRGPRRSGPGGRGGRDDGPRGDSPFAIGTVQTLGRPQNVRFKDYSKDDTVEVEVTGEKTAKGAPKVRMPGRNKVWEVPIQTPGGFAKPPEDLEAGAKVKVKVVAVNTRSGEPAVAWVQDQGDTPAPNSDPGGDAPESPAAE